MSDTSSFDGAALRAAREAKGYTLRALAGLVGCSHVLLVTCEQGRTLPSWQTACKLADILGTSLDTFRTPK